MKTRETVARDEMLPAALVLAVSAVAPSLILWASGHHGQTGFPLDDAWIHLVYGRSIADGGYPAYNAGVPSTGTTSPLWAYVLGLLHVMLRDTSLVVWGAKVLGIVLHSATAFLCYRLVSRTTSSVWTGSVAGAFLGSCPALAATALSGMEIPLGCALCLAGVLLFLRERWRLGGVLLGLAGLTRPEFGIVAVVLLGDMLLQMIRKRRSGRSFLNFTAPLVLLACLFAGWNLGVDGRPFPATFYAKAMPAGGGMDWTQRLSAGLGMMTRSAPLHVGILALGALGLALVKGAARRDGLLYFLSGILYWAGNLALVPPFHPEAFYHIRYLLPAVPLLLVGAATGIAFGAKALGQFVGKRRKERRIAARAVSLAVPGAIVVLLAAWTVVGLRFWTIKYSRDCRNIDEVQVELGKAIERALGRDARVGTIDAGAIRYFGRRVTVDLMGLNTPVFSDGDCRGEPLDALVLMPAWVRLPSAEDLVPVLVRETDDYQVTANPAMGRQLIAVCRSDSPAGEKSFRLQILRRTQHLCLKCLGPAEVDEITRTMARR
jgi:hypothetical protein